MTDIRLCDYLIVDALMILLRESVRSLDGHMQTLYSKYHAEKEDEEEKSEDEEEVVGYRREDVPLFTTQIVFENDSLSFVPSGESFFRAVDELTNDYVKTVASIDRLVASVWILSLLNNHHTNWEERPVFACTGETNAGAYMHDNAFDCLYIHRRNFRATCNMHSRTSVKKPNFRKALQLLKWLLMMRSSMLSFSPSERQCLKASMMQNNMLLRLNPTGRCFLKTAKWVCCFFNCHEICISFALLLHVS
jgi:hypothetical protein